MSNWKIVTAVGSTNKVENPSAEIAGNYGAVGGGTASRVTTYQHYGLYSFRAQTSADNDGIAWDLSTLSNAIHYATVRVRGTLPTSWDWSLDNSNYTAPTLLEQIDANWALYGLQFPAAQANGATTFYVRQNGAGSGDFYLDGIQVEQLEYWTTYIDGTQPGCTWNGPAHAASSTRSGQSLGGGRVEDLQDDYSFDITGMVGTGTTKLNLGVDSFAILPGGQLNSIKTESRPFTLTGTIRGTSWADLHSKRQALINVFSSDNYPETESGKQPIRLRYNGATVHKEIAAFYEQGFEGDFKGNDLYYWEMQVAIRLIAPNPFWHALGESAASLDTNDSATFRVIAARLRSTGQWNPLGPPGTGGSASYTDIEAIAEDATYIYLGGQFTNFNGIAAADNIVRYNKLTGAYSAMGTGANNGVADLIVMPNGDVIAAGTFTSMGGVANTAYIARWNGSSWNALGTGLGDYARGLVVGLDGTLYVTGDFTTAGGGAAVRIAKWNGSAWSAMGSGLNSYGNALAVLPNGDIVIAGAFTTAGGSSANYIVTWDVSASAYTAMGSGMNDEVMDVVVDSRGLVYAGGAFSTAGGNSASRIAIWNGTSWTALGSGLNDTAWEMAIAPDDTLIVGGDFTTAGSIAIADNIARFNGYAWAHVDVDLPSAPAVYIVYPSLLDVDPITKSYSLYIGFNQTGTGTYAGKTTVSNGATIKAFPKFIISRSGGTSATIETLRNETTGRELLFDYDLLDGETLTIDMDPTNLSVVSSFFGSRPGAILSNSDFGLFSLKPGSNDITSFVATAGGPTITAYLLWQPQYASQD